MTPLAEIYGFRDFLFKDKRNRVILCLAAAAIILQFAIFKYLYPFASYIHGDSFSYLNAADKNLTLNTYLVGYSKFLRFVSIFAKPDYILVSLQYLMIHCSVLFLLFTIFYFYKATRTVQTILICFMVFNPLFWHLGNMVSSDGFFLSLSCTWFGLLLWIIHRPSNKIILLHAAVLFVAFTTRYNALIYPAIATLAFLISNSLSWKKRLYGMGLALALCGLFVGFTSWRYKILTGYWQYSPFSGWQLANNAMYMYRHIDSADRKPVPKKYRDLDKMIQNFFYNTRKTKYLVDNEASTFYMWSPTMPLVVYQNRLFYNRKDTTATELKKWATMGPFYKEYGSYLIKHNFWSYAWYFARYNARKYYSPPVEFLDEYNSGKNHVSSQASKWFGYKNNHVYVRMGDKEVWTLEFYPILSGIINIIMLFGLLYYVSLKGWQYASRFNKTILLAASVWLINAGFTIFASSAALRFQSFPIILTTTFTLLLVDWMIQLMQQLKSATEAKKTGQSENSINEHALA